MGNPLRIVHFTQAHPSLALQLPVYSCRVPAGFPSAADDYLDSSLDLTKRYVSNPASTFFCYVEGDSMKDACIHSGDLLIVDRSVKPRHNYVTIACLDGELTVKRYCVRQGRPYLVAANPDYSDIHIFDGQELLIWGVVMHNMHSQPYA